jgi:hypothetical protein
MTRQAQILEASLNLSSEVCNNAWLCSIAYVIMVWQLQNWFSIRWVFQSFDRPAYATRYPASTVSHTDYSLVLYLTRITAYVGVKNAGTATLREHHFRSVTVIANVTCA